MAPFLNRRHFVAVAGCALLLARVGPVAADTLDSRFQSIEQRHRIRLGLWALDTGSGQQISFRANERFAQCSTFKVMLTGAVLKHSVTHPDLLNRRVSYDASHLVTYSPITKTHVDTGMTVGQLCSAALQYSDNTAANLLLDLVGGPAAVTAYAREIGDPVFRLDRREPELNSAVPGDLRDTTTAQAMGMSAQRLLLGDALRPSDRQQLQAWMLHNTTGDTRIRAGIPAGWAVADKTGSGDYGVANDIAVIWPEHRAPWVVSVYTSGAGVDAAYSNEAIAAATQVVVESWR